MLSRTYKKNADNKDVANADSTVYCPCEIAILQEWWDDNTHPEVFENRLLVFNTLHPKTESAFTLH